MNIKTEITKIHYNKNVNNAFYSKEGWGVEQTLLFTFLKFCSFFYGIGSASKNFFYDHNILKPKKVNAYVISVGNFTTGGVGKTPVVAELARYFVDKGERVAIVSRGYGGKLNNKKVNVISDGINLYYKADMAGDEPYWLAVNLNMCAVLTCSNRAKACEYAIKELGVTKIILDDGFQHRKLHRDLDLVLVDSEKQFGNGYQLPAGPLREKVDFKRVDKVIVVSKNINHTKAEEFIRTLPWGRGSSCSSGSELQMRGEGFEILLCKIEPDYAYNIISGEHLEKGTEVTAISAIGQPEQFYQFLEPDYKIKEKITFDDHHQYILADIENIEGNIITTEKDAVKLALLGKPNIYALKLKTVLDIGKIL